MRKLYTALCLGLTVYFFNGATCAQVKKDAEFALTLAQIACALDHQGQDSATIATACNIVGDAAKVDQALTVLFAENAKHQKPGACPPAAKDERPLPAGTIYDPAVLHDPAVDPLPGVFLFEFERNR